jgi:hypothetical protein
MRFDMKNLKYVHHITQPTNFSCAHACLSMVTGIDVYDIISRWTRPISHWEVLTILSEEGIGMIPYLPGVGDPFDHTGVYLVTVPSLNKSGVTHSVIMTLDEEGEYTVYDPNKGRQINKDQLFSDDQSKSEKVIRYYTADNFFIRNHNSDIPPMRCCEAFRLISLRDHRATPARIDRMQKLLNITQA